MRYRFTVVAVACLVLVALAPRQGGAQIPDEFTNLKLLDPEISKQALIGTMKNWAGGLGVRCNHCHVGPDNLQGMDFASDEKATKRTARRMLEMARAINGDLLADLPVVEAGQGHQVVSCYTCHRGQSKPPQQITVALGGIAAEQGVDAALEHYDALRAEHFGAGVYDFSESALAAAAGSLMEMGDPDGAVKVLHKSLEHYPDSADSWAMIAMVRLQSGSPEAAPAVERALALDPENRLALRVQQAMAAKDGSGG